MSKIYLYIYIYIKRDFEGSKNAVSVCEGKKCEGRRSKVVSTETCY